VQLQARNLSEFFSAQEKEASSNKFSSLEEGLSSSSTNQRFQNLQIWYVSQILQWIPTKPNDGEAKGSLLELFQKDFLRIYHWRKVVCLFVCHIFSNGLLSIFAKPFCSVIRILYLCFRLFVSIDLFFLKLF
jgi:hypothetical protein